MAHRLSTSAAIAVGFAALPVPAALGVRALAASEPIRPWRLSDVERRHLRDGSSVVLKVRYSSRMTSAIVMPRLLATESSSAWVTPYLTAVGSCWPSTR